LTDEEIKVFIDGAAQYFERVSGEPATIEAPFLKGEEPLVLEYTGVIGISGRHRGAVYFTAGSDLAVALLETFGEEETGELFQADLVGEVANTIAGNARRYFGNEFMISVPTVLRGRPEDITFPRQLKSFVIPIFWRGFRCYLIVCLETKHGSLGTEG
jgi:chemotaxis protein CheX